IRTRYSAESDADQDKLKSRRGKGSFWWHCSAGAAEMSLRIILRPFPNWQVVEIIGVIPRECSTWNTGIKCSHSSTRSAPSVCHWWEDTRNDQFAVLSIRG